MSNGTISIGQTWRSDNGMSMYIDNIELALSGSREVVMITYCARKDAERSVTVEAAELISWMRKHNFQAVSA